MPKIAPHVFESRTGDFDEVVAVELDAGPEVDTR